MLPVQPVDQRCAIGCWAEESWTDGSSLREKIMVLAQLGLVAASSTAED
jgi:hypothetical protein